MNRPRASSEPASSTMRLGAHRWRACAAAVAVALSVGVAALARADAVPTNRPTIVTVASPDIVLGAGHLSDTAFVLGRVDPQPGATIDFALYGPDDATCAGAPLFQSVRVPYPVEGGPVSSASLTPAAAGTYRWRATYSGDANNLPVSGACNDPNENVVVSEARAGTTGSSSALPLLSPFPVVRVAGRGTRRGVRITTLTVRAQVGAFVVSRCAGSRRFCSYRQRVSQLRGAPGQVRTFHVRAFERVFRAGIVLRVFVVDAGRTGKFTSFKIRRGRPPLRTDHCVLGLVLNPLPCTTG